MKQITVWSLLKDYRKKDTSLALLILNCALVNVPVEDFEKQFGTMSEETMIKFIKDSKNSFALSRFGHQFNNKNNIKAYNGKSLYKGVRCTLSAHKVYH